jgi:hypothetical protein
LGGKEAQNNVAPRPRPVEEKMLDAKGGCLCGAVRYEVHAEPALVGVCHCRDCQKFTGSAFSFLVAVPLAALKIEGVFKTFSKPGDSGQPILRRFCGECGSSIAEEASTRPGLLLLNGGTLDDPAAVTPTFEIYCDRELTWARLGAGMERFARAPA